MDKSSHKDRHAEIIQQKDATLIKVEKNKTKSESQNLQKLIEKMNE